MVVTNSMLRFTKLRFNRDRAPGNDPRGKNNSTRHDFAKHAACTRRHIKELDGIQAASNDKKKNFLMLKMFSASTLNKSCNVLYDNR